MAMYEQDPFPPQRFEQCDYIANPGSSISTIISSSCVVLDASHDIALCNDGGANSLLGSEFNSLQPSVSDNQEYGDPSVPSLYQTTKQSQGLTQTPSNLDSYSGNLHKEKDQYFDFKGFNHQRREGKNTNADKYDHYPYRYREPFNDEREVADEWDAHQRHHIGGDQEREMAYNCLIEIPQSANFLDSSQCMNYARVPCMGPSGSEVNGLNLHHGVLGPPQMADQYENIYPVDTEFQGTVQNTITSYDHDIFQSSTFLFGSPLPARCNDSVRSGQSAEGPRPSSSCQNPENDIDLAKSHSNQHDTLQLVNPFASDWQESTHNDVSSLTLNANLSMSEKTNSPREMSWTKANGSWTQTISSKSFNENGCRSQQHLKSPRDQREAFPADASCTKSPVQHNPCLNSRNGSNPRYSCDMMYDINNIHQRDWDQSEEFQTRSTDYQTNHAIKHNTNSVSACVDNEMVFDTLNEPPKKTDTKGHVVAKTKDKKRDSVESMQRQLQVLEEQRRSEGLQSFVSRINGCDKPLPEDGSEVSKETEQVVLDVDHMICSGVTVAGFKPRAIIRKRNKIPTNSKDKDTCYWQKRRKNNDSARKSREAKKEKEKSFYKRALELEYENLYLHKCLGIAEAKIASLGQSLVLPPFSGDSQF